MRWGCFGCEHEERVRVPPGCPGGRGCLSPVPPLFDGGGGWWGACCRVLGRCALVVVLRVGLVPFLFGGLVWRVWAGWL